MSSLVALLDSPPPLTAPFREARLRDFARLLAEYVEPRYAEGLVQPVAGRLGYQELIAAPNPAPGSSYRFRVPGEYVARPLSVLAQLATDATVGERSVTLEYQDAADVRYLVAGVQATLAAAQTQSFCWHPLAGDVAWAVDDVAIAPLPQQMIYPGSSLVVKVGNAQAADQLSLIRLVVEKYPTGQPEAEAGP